MVFSENTQALNTVDFILVFRLFKSVGKPYDWPWIHGADDHCTFVLSLDLVIDINFW